jgi:hypothetical protein
MTAAKVTSVNFVGNKKGLAKTKRDSHNLVPLLDEVMNGPGKFR